MLRAWGHWLLSRKTPCVPCLMSSPSLHEKAIPVHLDGFESLSRNGMKGIQNVFHYLQSDLTPGHGSGDKSHRVGSSLFWSRFSEHSVPVS